MKIDVWAHKRFLRWMRFVVLILMLLALIVLAPSPALLPGAFAQEMTLYAQKPLPIDNSPGYSPDQDAYLADGTGYQDASLSVNVEMTRAFETDIMLVTVHVADPSQIRTAMATYYGSNATAFGSTIAKHNHAVLAINGDFFSIHSGGYLVRQGRLYCNFPNGRTDALIIDDHGDFHIIPDATAEMLAAFDGVVVNSFYFGPALVVDGVIHTDLDNAEAGPQKLAQRICVGQTGPLTYLCVATEGPENEGSCGLTLDQFAQYVSTLGCINAYNLDGGSSSTVVLNNQKINALSTGKIRPICDILYFATAVPSP